MLSSFNAKAFYQVPLEIVTSPVLLINYVDWVKKLDEFVVPDSETRSFRELVHIIYDAQIGRPWGERYFPEADLRLKTFRSKVCQHFEKTQICQAPESLTSPEHISVVVNGLLDKTFLKLAQERWKLRIDSVEFLTGTNPFDLWVTKEGQKTVENMTFWNLTPVNVPFVSVKPILLEDVQSYLVGFSQSIHNAISAQSKNQVLINENFVKTRAMEFGDKWKAATEAYEIYGKKRSVLYSNEFQLYRMHLDNVDALKKKYSEFLEIVKSDAKHEKHLKRYLKDNAEKKFPNEVYHAVAYELLSSLLKMQQGYLYAAEIQRHHVSARMRVLESLATVQKNFGKLSLFLVEIATRSEPLTSNAAIIDQVVLPDIAQTYMTEMFKVIFEKDDYADKKLFSKF